MAIDTQPIGSAGTLVAAGLQTAGMYLQSSLLDVILSPYGSNIGMFLYTLSAVVAIIILALGGNYKFGLWFLIGPAIFYQLVAPREIATVTSWQLGQRLHHAQLVGRTVRGVGEGAATTTGKTVYVSSFFALWDSIVSSTVQTAVRALLITDVKSDLDFLGKAQRFQLVFNADVQNTTIQKFVRLVALHPDCAEYLSLKRLQGVNVPDKVWANNEIDARVQELGTRVVVSENTDNYRFLLEAGNSGFFGDAFVPAASYTCGELYVLAITALRSEAQSATQRISYENRPNGLSPNDTYHELVRKFSDKMPASGPWDPDAPATVEAIQTMINSIAVNMFVRTLQTEHPETQKYFLNPGLRSDESDKPYDPSEDLRTMAQSHEYQGKGDYLIGMLALPYLQGVVLFFLSFTFPVFCFVLLIPGRHHTFFWWMGMWLWVKTWDFGFAVVMMLDELLYYLLPRSPMMTGAQAEDPAQAFRLLLQADPTYSVQTYYNLLATCIAAVPIITGFLVKKGGSEIMDAVGQGFGQFGGKIGGSMTSNARATMASNILGHIEQEKVGAGRQAMMSALSSDAVRTGLGINIGRSQLDTMLKTPEGQKAYLGQVSKALRNPSNSFQKDKIKAQVEVLYRTAMVNRSLDKDMVALSDKAVLMKWYSHEHSYRPMAMWEDLAVAETNYQWGSSMNDVYKQVESRIVDTSLKGLVNGKLGADDIKDVGAAILGAGAYANLEKMIESRSDSALAKTEKREQEAKKAKTPAKSGPKQIEERN